MRRMKANGKKMEATLKIGDLPPLNLDVTEPEQLELALGDIEPSGQASPERNTE
jgi:hypothetical protein